MGFRFIVNSLLYGLSESSLANLHHVQNAAVRLVTLSHNRVHVTPLLLKLHWLPIKQHIKYKILLLNLYIVGPLHTFLTYYMPMFLLVP